MQFPSDFIALLQNIRGIDAGALLQALQKEPPVSVRINPAKPPTHLLFQEQVPWCRFGYYLDTRPVFTLDPFFHAGTYYVQEASSMFIEQWWKHIVPQNYPLRVLDMCAAPGGKSTHLLSLMPKSSVLICNEPINDRHPALHHNIAKWGHSQVIITQNNPEDFETLEAYFDVILVDAPCSGEGMFRKDSDAVAHWSTENVRYCAKRQTRILHSAVKALKPGGVLIYATCTFNETENEAHAEALYNMGLQAQNLTCVQDGIVSSTTGYRFYPHLIRGEGFYTACFIKEGKWLPTELNDNNTSPSHPIMEQYLSEPHTFSHHTQLNRHYAMPFSVRSVFNSIKNVLRVRLAGIPLGEYKGNTFIPAAQLAFSIHLRSDVPGIDVTSEEALKFLRGETFPIQSEIKGWHLVRYNGLALGWAKLINGRFNNYYPKPWRIRMR
ncbi:MAG: RNA methyltransferase [Chitinophagales bacterium]|nr:RNA methyltransferase [Chitinophagales bacterium]MDW8419048.1 RNA methyltransferase [Chitinophagales bacterium]